MSKKTRASDFSKRITFYAQTTRFNEETGMTETVYVEVFKRWAKVKVIFREQLEAMVSGANTLRDRLELTLRYAEDIDSTMAFQYKGEFYNISIKGDKSGLRQEISLLGEAIRDGGE